MRIQRRDKNRYISLKVANKMRKLVARGYTTEGLILALLSLFSVPKVIDDIRMVFDETVSGLNDFLWYPNFMLPSMGSLLMMVGPEMHMVNLDVGEFFIRFYFHWLLPSIAEWILDPIWSIRSTAKEDISVCGGYAS